MIIKYFKEIGMKRIIIMTIGNIFLGLGISIFKFSGLGNDPFSGMVMALSDQTGIAYAQFLILVNIILFVFEFILGKHFIGVGTFVNAILLGYFVTFFHNILSVLFGAPPNMFYRIITVCAGVIVCSFGVSLYQTPDVGVAPYDSLSLIMAGKYKKVSYFWHRMLTDITCAVICYFAGGIIGLGTLVSALGLGPIIHFFNVYFTNKLLGKNLEIDRQGR